MLADIGCKDTCIRCLSLATAEHRMAKGRGPTGTGVPRQRSSQLTATHYLGLLLFTTHCFGCSRQLPNVVTKNHHSFCDLGRDGRPTWEIREISRARLQWKLRNFVTWRLLASFVKQKGWNLLMRVSLLLIEPQAFNECCFCELAHLKCARFSHAGAFRSLTWMQTS